MRRNLCPEHWMAVIFRPCRQQFPPFHHHILFLFTFYTAWRLFANSFNSRRRKNWIWVVQIHTLTTACLLAAGFQFPVEAAERGIPTKKQHLFTAILNRWAKDNTPIICKTFSFLRDETRWHSFSLSSLCSSPCLSVRLPIQMHKNEHEVQFCVWGSLSPDVAAVVRPCLLAHDTWLMVCVCSTDSVCVYQLLFCWCFFSWRRGQTASRGRPCLQSGPAVFVRPPSAWFDQVLPKSGKKIRMAADTNQV